MATTPDAWDRRLARIKRIAELLRRSTPEQHPTRHIKRGPGRHDEPPRV